MDVNYLSVNSTVSETLGEAGDYYNPTEGYYYDAFQLTNLTPGVPVTITMSSNNFDTWMMVYNGEQYIGSDNDSGLGTNSQFTFTPVLGDENNYVVYTSSAGINSTGNYVVTASYG